MEYKWNLKELFLNDEDFYAEIDEIRKLILEIKKYRDIQIDEENLYSMLQEKWAIKERTNNVLIYGSLKYYQNIKSEDTIKLKKTAEEFSAEVEADLSFIDEKIVTLGYDKVKDYMRLNSNIQDFEFYLDNLFRLKNHVQNEDVNNQIKNRTNRINELLSLYNKLRDMEYGKINIDGEEIEITTSNYLKYISSKDRDTRKSAYILVNQAYKRREDEFAKILDEIFGCRIEISNLKRYSSVLESVLDNEKIDEKIIFTLIDSVHKNLVYLQKYLEIKAKKLNVETPHLYDFTISLNKELNIKYTLEEAVEIIKNALKPLGEKYISVIDALLNGHVDASVDECKHQSITFSWNTYSFLNFRGSYVDLKNLAHELGHIVNYYLSKEELPFIYQDSTVFVGETASIVNEVLLNRYLYENAENDEERMFYLSKEIENYFSSVFIQTMYTEYENELYKIKSNEVLTAEILGHKYGELVKKYYGDVVTYDEDFLVEWTRLGHIFRWSYYPYKYATGLLIANIIVTRLLDEKTLELEDYIRFLSLGSSMYSLDLLKTIGIDLTNPKVLDDGFKILERDVKKLEKII